MNEEARLKLEEILKKEIPEMNEADKVFLRARRSYVNQKQLETFKEVLEPIKPEGNSPRISYRELQKKAKALGRPYIGVSREELEKIVT